MTVYTLALSLACVDGHPGAATDPLRSLSVEASSVSVASITFERAGPGRVAVACTARDDPREVHLVEVDGDTAAISGLLPSTDYDCVAAATNGDGSPHLASLRTPDPAGELPEADAIASPALAMTGAYTVMTVRRECAGGNNQIAVLDPDGRNRFRYALPPQTNIGVEVTVDGPDRLLWGGGKAPIGAPTQVALANGEQWKVAFPGSEALEFHHDGKRIADGRLLAVADDWSAGWAAFVLTLTDDDGAVSWSWSAHQAVADGWLTPGSAENHDPHHLNWADVVETDDGWTAFGSLCFAYQIVAIDVATGDRRWRFGYGGDFTLVDAAGAPLPAQDDFPQCQHGLSTDGGHLLVYDNGFDRQSTRAVEYELDTDTMTARKTWEYLDEGFYEPYHGNADWLDPDHERVLIAEASNGCDGPDDRPSQVVELDRALDAEVHRLVLRDPGDWIYRAHRVDGCDLFTNTRFCPALAERLAELRPLLAP